MALSNKQYKTIGYIVVIAIVVVTQLLDFFKSDKSASDYTSNTNNTSKPIYYTQHAKCRMGCRFIDKSEIDFIRKNGKINHRKSDLQDKPCPTIAKEGRTKDGQMVRIVFAECDRETKVVTAIDLEENHKCNCK